MAGSVERVRRAFAHQTPDRTPLFEIFQTFHPIHWDICGCTLATEESVSWDALAEGVSWEELVEAQAQAIFAISKFFELDIVRAPGNSLRSAPQPKPVKKRNHRWELGGREYRVNPRTQLMELADLSSEDAYSNRLTEATLRKQIEEWDGATHETPAECFTVFNRIRELAQAEGLDWMYMAEIGAGTGVAFYPPFQLMWLVEEPDLFRQWINMVKTQVFRSTRETIAAGYDLVAMGGDVSCDKGPFLSPAHYHEFIFPVIKEHVDLIHECGATAVYTSDGNHWAIKDDFFFNSGIDGYKEVDKAAGMTFERLIDEGVAERVCILGNMDARHTLCHGTPEEVRSEVFHCLTLGQQTPGGHILHASHSVHEDVKAGNYCAMVNAYREYFGMERLPRPTTKG
ncbi:MAG: hypothetical protein HY318_18770 [Armatimonadetes bacterium]|nr:hypothetical protein [Armatimonadota bacterium]